MIIEDHMQVFAGKELKLTDLKAVGTAAYDGLGVDIDLGSAHPCLATRVRLTIMTKQAAVGTGKVLLKIRTKAKGATDLRATKVWELSEISPLEMTKGAEVVSMDLPEDMLQVVRIEAYITGSGTPAFTQGKLYGVLTPVLK